MKKINKLIENLKKGFKVNIKTAYIKVLFTPKNLEAYLLKKGFETRGVRVENSKERKKFTLCGNWFVFDSDNFKFYVGKNNVYGGAELEHTIDWDAYFNILIGGDK